MIVYTGSLEDSHELIQFYRREAAKLREMRRLIVSRERTVVRDVNGDGLEFPGLTYGSANLEELLREPSPAQRGPGCCPGTRYALLSARSWSTVRLAIAVKTGLDSW